MPSPRDLPDPGNKLGSPALQVDSLPTELSRKPLLLFFFFFGCTTWLAGSQFPVQRLSLGPGNDSAES